MQGSSRNNGIGQFNMVFLAYFNGKFGDLFVQWVNIRITYKFN